MVTETKPLGWCRAERLSRGIDIIVDETSDYTLVRCVDGDSLHRGQWILWDGQGKCLAIGPEAWCRKKIDQPETFGRSPAQETK